MKIRILPILLIVGALGGCATVPRDAGFADVQKTIADRAGHLVQWHGNTADDAAVKALLQRELSADEAVQIALLNNRRLQAVAQTEAQLTADRERLNRLLSLWEEQTAWKVADRLPNILQQEISVEHLESLAIRQRLDLGAGRAQLVTLGQALAVTGGFITR